MAGWHHRLHGHEFGWTPGVGDGQGGLACCDSWGHKESDTTEVTQQQQSAHSIQKTQTRPVYVIYKRPISDLETHTDEGQKNIFNSNGNQTEVGVAKWT